MRTKSRKKNAKAWFKKKAVKVALVCGVATVAASSPAIAQDLSPVTTFVTNITTALTGPLGRAIGLLAIIGVGLAAMANQLQWKTAIMVCVGLAIVFGGATILAGF